MRIRLITTSGVRVGTRELAEPGVTPPRFVRHGRGMASLPSLGLLSVAALAPPGIGVEYFEYDARPDSGALRRFALVGIPSFTAPIATAGARADRYRAGGGPVVPGSLHVSLLPDDAAALAAADRGCPRRWHAETRSPPAQGRLRQGQLCRRPVQSAAPAAL